MVDEVYARGQTLDELIPALDYLRAQHHIETFYADPSEPAYIAPCRRAGLPMVEARNDVAPGLQAVSRAIAAGMLVDPGCVGLLGEIGNYVWATERGGGQREVPRKVDDDACDALRYAVVALEPDAANPWASLVGRAVRAIA